MLDIYLHKTGKHPQTLIDGTAGLGGHVLSFGLKTQVPSVYAIELDIERFGVMAGE